MIVWFQSQQATNLYCFGMDDSSTYIILQSGKICWLSPPQFIFARKIKAWKNVESTQYTQHDLMPYLRIWIYSFKKWKSVAYQFRLHLSLIHWQCRFKYFLWFLAWSEKANSYRWTIQAKLMFTRIRKNTPKEALYNCIKLTCSNFSILRKRHPRSFLLVP